jgi:hypothetical protein
MSEYVEFYRGERTTPLGDHDIHAILNFDDKHLEKEHGFVQFAFPNPKLSTAQPDAATQPFTPEAAQEMLRDAVIVARVKQMVDKMLGFWGIDSQTLSISNRQRFTAKLRRTNHNQQRMTRLLIFLKCMGWTELLNGMQSLLEKNPPSSKKVMGFWTNAWESSAE